MPFTPKQLIMLVVAIAATVAAATFADPFYHVVAAALVSLYAFITAFGDNSALRNNGAIKSAIAAATARHFAWVWLWGGLAILLTYTLIIDRRWPEWWQFAAGFTLAGVMSLFFARGLARDASAGKADEGMLKAGRWLTIAQMVGVIAALATMFIEGKYPRSTSYADWAGINIFMFGGLAIVLISINALREQSPD